VTAWQNLAEFYGWQNMAECGTLRQIAAHCVLVTGLIGGRMQGVTG